MDKTLRAVLVARGLPSTATEAQAKSFYASVSPEEKSKIGVEVGRKARENTMQAADGITTRSTVEATRDITTRSFCIRAESADDETRSVEAVIVTDDPVTVSENRTGELIDEVLRMDGLRSPGQVPMLANHSRWSLDDVFGSTREIKTGEHEATGRLFFAGDDASTRAWAKVRDGHLQDVSAGYRVEKFVDIRAGQTAVVKGKTYTAKGRTLRISTDWTLKEVSLVPIGADSRSKIRADLLTNEEEMDETRKDQEETQVGATKEVRTETPQVTEERAEQVDPAEVARQAVVEERERVRGLNDLAGDDVAPEVLQRAIDDGWSVEKSSPEFLKSVRERGPSGPAQHSRSHDKDCTARSLAAGCMASRGLDPTKHSMHAGQTQPGRANAITEEDAERGDQYIGMSAYDLVRECILIDTGKHVRTMNDTIDALRATPSGGTLAHVFSTNVYASLVEGWNQVADTSTWADSEDVQNFLTQEDISLEADTTLKPLPRGGTAKDATISDSHETYKIARYARKWVADEQDIINDRLGALLKMPVEMGAAAARLRPDLVYSILLANDELIADNGVLFNATAVTTSGGHANLTTADLAADAIQAAILAMGAYRSDDAVLNIRPRFLIVPSALQWIGKELLTSTALAKVGDTDNTFYPINVIADEGLTLVIDDRIGVAGVTDPTDGEALVGTATNFFLSAGGSRTIRVAYRAGTGRRPTMRSFNLDQGQWGMGWDINMDIGAKAMDYRGLHKSTGAS